MKILFLFVFIFFATIHSKLALASIENYDEFAENADANSSDDEYVSSEKDEIVMSQFQLLREEIDFLDSKSKKIENFLERQNNNLEQSATLESNTTTDEVSLTHSAVKREPAVLNDDDLRSLLDNELESNTRTRRVRSR
jgi:hypothetical protein